MNKINASRVIFAASILVAASSLSAATDTWSSTTGGDWATATNWGGIAPSSGDTLVFGGTTAQTLTDTLTNASFGIAGITFNNTGAYTIGGNAFLLNGSIGDTAASGTQTINNAVVLGGTQSVTAASGSQINLGGVISDGGSGYGLNINGAGTVLLSGYNSFSGGVNLSAGTLRIAGGATTPALGAGTVTVSGNATLASNGALGGAVTVTNVVSVNSGSTLSVDGGADLLLSGAISGAGALKAVFSGNVFLLNTNNSFSGGATIAGTGTLWGTAIGNTGANGSFGSANTITITAFGSLGYLGTGETTNKTINFSTGNGGLITNNAGSGGTSALTLSSVTAANAAMGITLNGGSDTVITNGITGSASLLNFAKNGAGMATIGTAGSAMFGTSTAANKITIGAGVLVLKGSTAAAATFARSTGAVVQFGGGSAVLSTTTNTNGILGGWATISGTDWAANSTNAAGGTVTALAPGAYTAATTTAFTGATLNEDVRASVTAAAAGSANSLRFNTAGATTLTLDGANLVTSGGILVTAAVGANTTTITGGTSLSAGALNAATDLIVNNFNNTGSVDAGTGVVTGGNLTIASVIANNGTGVTSLTASGPGVTVLSGANTYTGTTYVEGGATLINNQTTGTIARVYQVAADSSLYLKTGLGLFYGYGVTVYGAGTADSTHGLFLNGGATYTFQSSLNLVGAPTTIRAYGTGNATLGGFDTGGVHLSVASTASGSVIASNVLLASARYGYVMNVSAGANTATGDLIVNSALTGSVTSIGSTAIAPTAGNGGAIFRSDFLVNNYSGTGSIRLNAAGTYANGLNLQSGSIIAGVDNALASGTGLFLGSGTNSGKLVLNGHAQTLGALDTLGTGTANAVVGANATLSTLTINNTANHTFGGQLGGAGANENNLALTKTGTGAFTLSGANTYTGGTNVNAGSLVTGNISSLGSGAVALGGGTLQVGATGIAGIASLTVNSGALNTTAGGVTTTGAFSLVAGTWTIGVTANGVTAGSFSLTGGTIDLGLLSLFDKRNSGFSLIAGTGTNTLTAANFANGDAGFTYGINNNGDLVVTAVPEPSTYGLIGAGALASVALVRRRRKTAGSVAK